MMTEAEEIHLLRLELRIAIGMLAHARGMDEAEDAGGKIRMEIRQLADAQLLACEQWRNLSE